MRRYVPKTYKNGRVLRVILGVIIAVVFAAVILFMVLFFSLREYFDGERLNWPPVRENDPVEEYYEYQDTHDIDENSEE